MSLTSHSGWLKRWTDRFLGRRSTTRRRQAPRKAPRPTIEQLEDRVVPTGGTWTQLANLAPDANGIQTMLLLSDGTVMANGGSDSASKDWYRLTPDATGSYVNGTWTTLSPMSLERLFYTSDVLPDGRVFVLGGEYTGPSTTETLDNTGQIYNPTTNTWTNITNFPQGSFGDDPSEVLANGSVLAGYIFGPQTYVYNPTSNTWSAGPTKLNSDRSDEEAWVKLPDGGILSYDVFDTENAQRYEPSLNQWVNAGAVPVTLETVDAELGPGFLLPDGRVFYIGGTSNTALYTPPATPTGVGSWAAGPTIPGGLGANDAPGAMEPNGDVLFAAGGTPAFSTGTTLFEYDPVANTITKVATPAALTTTLNADYEFNTRMVELPSGQILYSTASDQLWVYTPNGSPNAAWRPTISSVARNGAGFTLTGTQLNGISEGAAYGDDASMASNYPIVSFTDVSGNVLYGRTSNWSSAGVQTGATPVTTQLTLPAADGTGAYLMNVSASGVISNNTLFLDMGANFNNVTLTIDAGNPADLDVLENGVLQGSFALSSFTSIKAVGDVTNDTLTLDFSNGNFIPSGGIDFNGGAGTNTLDLTGTSPFTNEVETPTATNAGSIVFDAQPAITFSNVTTLDDTTTISGKATYNGTAAAETIAIANGGTVNGVAATQISAATIPTVAFANKPTVVVAGVGGADTFNVNDSIRAAGLNVLNVVAGPTAGNSFNVLATPASLVTNIVGGGAAATVTVASAANSVQGIAGTLNIENPGGLNTLVVNDSADATARTVTLSTLGTDINDSQGDNDPYGQISGLAPAKINYEYGDTTALTISGGTGGNTFLVNATLPGHTTTINGGAGADIFTINGSGLGAGSTNVFNGQAGDDSFAVTSALAGGAILDIDGGTGNNTLKGTNLGDTFNVTGANTGNDTGVVTLFTNIQNLIGGTGTDKFVFSDGASLGGRVDGGAGSDTLNLSAYTTTTSAILTGLGAIDSFTGSVAGVTGFTDVDTLLGSMTFTPQTMTGTNLNAVWTIGVGGADTYAAGGHTLSFSNYQNLTGGSGNDSFVIATGATAAGVIDGGAGSNTLTGPNLNETWHVTSANAGNITGVVSMFQNIQNLIGGSGADDFVFADGGTLSGGVDGGAGSDTLDLSAYTTATDAVLTGLGAIDGYAGTVTGITGFTDMEQLTGSHVTGSTITGLNANATWDLGAGANDSYTQVGSGRMLAFSGFFNLTGGTGADDFVFTDGVTVNGVIDGGAGADTLDFSLCTTVQNVTLTGLGATDGFAGTLAAVGGGFTNINAIIGSATASPETMTGTNLNAVWTIGVGGADTYTIGANSIGFSNYQNLTGGSGNDSFIVATGATAAGVIDGGAGSNTLTGPNLDETWHITGANSGSITGVVAMFQNIQNLIGGSGADDFVFSNVGTLSGTLDGDAGANTLDFSADTAVQNVTLTGLGATDGFAGTETAVGGGFADITAIVGSATASPETMTGTNLDAVWTIGVGGADTYTIGANSIGFTNYQNLTGGSGNDSFVIATGATAAGVIDGGGGNNTLTGPNLDETWHITGANSGSITGVVAMFQNIQNLIGGSGTDDFVFADGGTLSGTLDGGAGANILDLSAYTTATDAALTGLGATDGYAGTVTGITGFTDVQTLTGSGVTGSTITGLNANATWDLGAGANDSYTQVGSGQTLAFSGFFNLTGGAGADDFVFTDGVTVNGVIDGGAGANTLDFSADTTAQNVTLTGLGGTDGFAGTEAAVSGGFTNINAIIGSATASPQTLTGANLNAVWSIAASGADSYTVGANTLAFTNYQNLTGGTGNDQFVFANGATFGGVLDGGAGVNTLNLSAYTTATKAALTGLGGMGGYVGTVSGITGFTDMQTLIGSATAGSTLTGLNAAAVWSLGTAGSDAYTKLGSGQTLAFSGFFNLTGGTGADAFVFATGATVAGVIDGGAGANTLDFSADATAQNVTLTGLGGTDGFAGMQAAIVGGFTDITAIIGSTAATAQTLTGTNANAVWTIGVGGADACTVGASSLAFSNFHNLTGGAGADDFVVAAGARFTGVIDGGGGSNTITGPNQDDAWNITGANAGDIQSVIGSFQNIQNLLGGTGADNFVFAAGGSVAGVIDGGAGIDGLDFSAEATAQRVTLTGPGAIDGFSGTVAAVGGGFTNINGLAGNQCAVLTGLNQNSIWYIGTTSQYATVGRYLTFTSFGTVDSGSAIDAFVVTGVPTALTLNSGNGADLFDVMNVTNVTAALTVVGGRLEVDDTAGTAGRVVTVTADSIGGGGGDSLFGPGGVLNYFDLQTLAFLGGAFGNTIDLVSQALGTSIVLDTGAGNDVVNVYVGPQSGYVGVVVNFEGGANGMQFFDETGGAVIKNLSAGPGEGDVTACYATGAQSYIDYLNLQAFVSPQSPDYSYIQALYHQFLHRDGSTADINAWVALLDSTQNRAAIASSIIQSPEARDVLVRGWYVQFLGRAAAPGEEAPLVNALLQGQSEETVLSGLLASSDYYARAGGTDTGFITQLFQDAVGRPPSADDYFAFEQTIRSRTGRGGAAYALLTSAEARGDMIFSLYATELERSETAPPGVLFAGLFGSPLPSAAEVNGLVFSGLDFTALRETLAGSQEFYTRVC